MSLATPTVAVTGWISAQLAAVPALAGVGVYLAAASDETPRPMKNVHGPYFTLRGLGSVDHPYLGGRIAGTSVVIEVTAWDEGTDDSRLVPLVEAMHAAIHGQKGTSPAPGSVPISSCVRVAPVERQTPEDDRLYTQLGGEYRVRASAA